VISDIASPLLVSVANATRATVKTRLVSVEIAINFARSPQVVMEGIAISRQRFAHDAMDVGAYKRTLKMVNVQHIAMYVLEIAISWKRFHVCNVSGEGM